MSFIVTALTLKMSATKCNVEGFLLLCMFFQWSRECHKVNLSRHQWNHRQTKNGSVREYKGFTMEITQRSTSVSLPLIISTKSLIIFFCFNLSEQCKVIMKWPGAQSYLLTSKSDVGVTPSTTIFILIFDTYPVIVQSGRGLYTTADYLLSFAKYFEVNYWPVFSI